MRRGTSHDRSILLYQRLCDWQICAKLDIKRDKHLPGAGRKGVKDVSPT